VLSTRPEATEVLLATARRDAVTALRDWIRDAAPPDTRITMAPLPALELTQRCRDSGTPELCIFVRRDGERLELLAVYCGAFVARSVVNVGNGCAESAREQVLLQVRRFAHSCRAGQPVAGMAKPALLSVDLSESESRLLTEELGATCHPLPVWLRATGLPEEWESYAPAAALALQDRRPYRLELPPEEAAVTRPRGWRPAEALLALAATLTLVGVALYSPISPIGITAGLQRQYARARESGAARVPSSGATQREGVLRSLMTEIDQDNLRWLEVLRLLSERIPPEVALTDLSMEAGGVVSLRGTAGDHAGVSASLHALRETGLFEEVRLSYAGAVTAEGRSQTQFQILGELPRSASAVDREQKR
jgi:hypothetical protein